jgi:hypothetical protein
MGKVSGKQLVLHVERPVQPPQLFADFSLLVTVFNSFGGIGRKPLARLAAGSAALFCSDLVWICVFMFLNMVVDFGVRTAEKIRHPHPGSFGLKTGWK